MFIDSRDKKNRDLDMVIAVAAHEIAGFDEMYFNDKKVWDKDTGIDPILDGWADPEFHTGVPGDPASPKLLARNKLWTANHKLEGIAYVVITLRHSATKFPGGIPNISFVLRGNNTITDPRDESIGYTNNAALCIRDFLIDTTLGLGTPLDEIDDASFIAGANLSDEAVALAEGGDEPRYLLDGEFDANTQYRSIIESMLSAMGARLTYTSGKFKLVNPVFTAPTVTINESHLRGSINVKTRQSRRDVFNGVRGVYAPAADNFVLSDYPPVVSDAFQQADGEPFFRDLPLPFTTSTSMAQRLAKAELLRGRRQITAVLPVNLAAMALSPGDKVAITIDRFGWAAKTFEVESWAFSVVNDGALGIDLSIVETDAAVFDWNTSDQQPHVAGVPTNLPDGFTITAPGLTASEEERTFNEEVVNLLIIDAGSSDQFFESFEVEYKLFTESIWRAAGRTATGRFEIVKVADGSTYDIRGRVRSVTGVLSDYTQISYTVNGTTTPPADVTGLTAAPSGLLTVLDWIPLTDLRLSHYIVRHTPKVAGASWETATIIVPKVARPASTVSVASRPGTYLVKAVDKLGRVSVNAATIVSPIAATDGLNVVQTITESPGFAGTHTSTENSGSGLTLQGTVLFDSAAGNFDDAAGNFDAASLPFSTTGTYEFASAFFDLGDVFTSRIFADLQFDATGGASAFDAQPGNFDAAEGLFDSFGAGEAPGLAAWIEMATTQDDPGGTPTWTAWAQLGVHEAEARAFKFRARLTSNDDSASPLVTTLGVTVDMPDRIASGQDVQSGTAAGGDVIVFDNAFLETPAIGISPQNMAQGDFFEILAKAATGFTVRFKDSSGFVIDRLYDWDAKGFGRVLT